MDEILQIILREKYQLEEHAEHNELHELGPQRYEEMLRNYNRIIQIATKGAEQNAA